MASSTPSILKKFCLSGFSSILCHLVGMAGTAILALLLSSASLFAQTAPTEGLRENTPEVHALTNARIVVAPGQIIEKGTVVVRKGVIVAVGEQVTPPADARIWDYSGKTIYPGLIETYSTYGLPTKKKPETEEREPKSETRTGPHHWNPHMHAERNAEAEFVADKKQAKAMRELGFCAALAAPDRGIFRGTSVLVSLGDDRPNKGVLKARVAHHLSFATSESWSELTYPNSLLGAIALIRQTFMDAQWYQHAWAAYRVNPKQPRPEEDLALAALNDAALGREPVVIEVTDDLNFLRAHRIAQELGLTLWVRGSGYEYRLLDEIKKTNVPVILPLNFPEAPNVNTEEEALEVELDELQHWDAAPDNPRRLHEAGVTFALTTATLKKPEDFPARVRKAIDHGLPSDAALAALTTVPAKLLGMEHKLGSVAEGRFANLVVTDGELFAEKTNILDVWVDGVRYEVKQPVFADLRGKWKLSLDTKTPADTLLLQLKGEAAKLQGEIKRGSATVKATVRLIDKRLALVFKGDSLGYKGFIRLSAQASAEGLVGTGVLADGSQFNWQGRRVEAAQEKDEKKAPAKASSIASRAYPYGGFGRTSSPEQPGAVLVRDATIWTCGPQGKIENADLLVKAGKIAAIGKDINPPTGALTVEAHGKHVTPGLVDAHSHSAANSINEAGQAVSAEVRIGDVVNSADIDIYRQLAGGLTLAHVMHGSANPMGGQNQALKLRWGAGPEGLKFTETPPTIKFALGENVKQSNWGERYTTRYPQTRMGVEQIMRDRFRAAMDYERAWATYQARKKDGSVIPPRRDLELETLLEILRGKRFIHCHSYRQDEILMLVRVAEEFGFKVGAFQHVLEGYKVAEAISAHGAGASCFSDWWAYKFEVYDAIPYNGALMHEQGIVVSFNSDSEELARRLNLEAAKAAKYGGLSEEEALKFVTLNPAKQLKVDHLVGSLESGKQADFVIWSGSPLSTYSVCEQTWIEGRKYFDRDEDLKRREELQKERQALIQKVLAEGKEEKEEGTAGEKPPTDD